MEVYMRKCYCVLIILVLVAAIAFISCSGKKKQIIKAEMDIRSIRMALLRYAMHDGKYPTTEQGLKALVEKPVLPPEVSKWEGPYLNPEYLIDPWGNKYVYRSPSTENPALYKFDLFSYGPNGKKDGKDDINVRAIEKIIEQQ
jgi:general secretion pathway protein G